MMKIFCFDEEVSRPITDYQSRQVGITPIHRSIGTSAPHRADGVQIGCFHFAAGGVVGYHPATVHQLFLVVQGNGWVRGETAKKTPITAGYAAFWNAGEYHESGTETGMTVIVIEGDSLDPNVFLQEVNTC